MISHAQYQLQMGLPSPAWVEKIFIKVQNAGNITTLTTTIENYITDTYGTTYGISVGNVESDIAESSTTYEMIALVFELILNFTIIICLFGLLSATYSTILERRREIAVIRTLGLRSGGVTTMFSLEALITFLSSASAGTIVGYFTAYLLSGVMNLFSESPQMMGFPLATFLRTFGISIIFLLAGLWILLRKVRKQKIIEIYRETL
jgi:ABC-type antimicrobial peptide transport system permease subunit